ncbi:MAG: hypothetical protein WBD40_14870 [Tepidisphaeraceae bacterium]
MQHANQIARLYLDEQSVGLIRVRGWADSWGFGEFQPEGSFAVFAAPFGRWSLLMHADDRGAPLSRAAADELREAENAIDRIHAKLYLCRTGEWRTITQLNIDGPLVEWKEDVGAGPTNQT